MRAGTQTEADLDRTSEKWEWAIDLAKEVPIVHIDGGEMQGAEAGHKSAKEWAMDHLRATEGWENEATGWRLHITTKGIQEAIHRLRWPAGLARTTLAAVPEMIRHAIPVQTEPDKAGRKDLVRVHTMVVPVAIHGDIYRGRLVARETRNDGHTYYGHALEGLDMKKSGAGGARSPEQAGVALAQTPDTIKVGDLLKGFKPHALDRPHD